MAANESSSANARHKKAARKRIIVEAIIAVIILSIAVVLSIYWKSILINRIYAAVELKPNSAGYKTWLKPPTTIVRGYHLFNISNHVDMTLDPTSTTLQVQETRPYPYLLSAVKTNVHWSTDYKSISYSINRTFTRHETKFDPSSVDDTGVFIDFVRVMFRTQFGAKPVKFFYDTAGVNAFYHRNAVEQLEGFTSEVFNMLRDKMVGPNTAKSGFVYRYNGSRSYNYTIKAGLTEKGQVLAFASENSLFSFSGSDYYGVPIYDGLTFVPMLFDKPMMNIFQADFCRPLNVKFNRVVSMFGGISVHEYIIRLLDLDQCTNRSDINTCPEVDQLDISKCISSSLPENTVFLSKPHYFGASNETMNAMNIAGFTPTYEKHQPLIYFEPYSGTPLLAHHRLQLNVEAIIDPMRKSKYDSELKPADRRGVRRMVPLLWIDQEVTMDKAMIRTLRLVHIAFAHGRTAIVVVAIVLILGIVMIMEIIARRNAKNQRSQRDGNPKSNTLL